MPVTGISSRTRLPRLIRVRLGVKDPSRGGAPRETDHFVWDVEYMSPRLSEETLSLYGAAPKSLRMMLPLEIDTLGQDGDELVWNVHNRAYGSGHGLRCKGTGGSIVEPGEAVTNDAGWAKRIGQATGVPARELGGDRWGVRCLGRDCCKAFSPHPEDPRRQSPGHDADAACRLVGVLRAFLLDPRPSDDPPRVLGIAEVATGSYNSILDIQSGLSVLRGFAGRTSAVPFWLVRRKTKTHHGGRAQSHWTCVVEADYAEAQRYGLTPPAEVFLANTARAELRALREAPIDVDSVRDLLPSTHAPRLAAPTSSLPPTEGGATLPAPPVGEPDEIVDATVDDDRDPDDMPPKEPESRPLVRAEKKALKALVGIDDDVTGEERQSRLKRLHDLASESFLARGEEIPPQWLSALTTQDDAFIRTRLAAQADPLEEWTS